MSDYFSPTQTHTSFSIVQITAFLFKKKSQCHFVEDLEFFDVNYDEITKKAPKSSDFSLLCDDDRENLEFKKEAIGFQFSDINEGYSDTSGIGYEIQNLGFHEVFEPFSKAIIKKAKELFAKTSEKDFCHGMCVVNFLGLFSYSYHRNYGDECDTEVGLTGFFSSNDIYQALFAKK